MSLLTRDIIRIYDCLKIQSDGEKFAFVIAPFTKPRTAVFNNVLRPCVTKKGYKCQRADDFKTNTNKGNDLFNISKFEESLVLYDKALDIDPSNVDALTRRGIALGVWGDLDQSDDLTKYKEALEWINKALAIDPEFLDAMDSKRLALDRLGSYDEAIVWFDKVLTITPWITGL